MKRVYWGLLLGLILSSPTLWSQEDNTEQILKQKSTIRHILEGARLGKVDTIAVIDQLNDSAYANSGYSQELFAKAALQLAEPIAYPQGLAEAYSRLGQAYADLGKHELAKLNLRKGIAWRKKVASSGLDSDRVYWANGYILLGQCFERVYQYDSAQLFYQKALAVYPPEAQLSKVALYNSYGVALTQAKQFQQASIHFKKAYAVLAQLPSGQQPESERITVLATLRMNYAALLQEHFKQDHAARDSLEASLKDFKKVPEGRPLLANCLLLLGNNAYSAGDLKKAKGHYQEALQLTLAEQNLDRAMLYKNLGRIALDQGEIKEASNNYIISKAQSKKNGDSLVLAAITFEQGNLQYEQDQYYLAIKLYREALALQPKDLLLRGRILFFLVDALEESGQSKRAEHYASRLTGLLEHIEEENGSGAFEELLEYQMSKQRLLKAFERLKTQGLRQRMYGLGIGLGALLLLLLLAYWLQRQKRFAAQQAATLAQQQEAMAVQEKMQVLQEKELETHYARLEAQEKVQQKIGQELHDDVGAMLATVKMKLLSEQEVLDHFPKEKTKEYAQANRLLNEACDKVRKLSHEFSEALLKKFGLKAQLEALQEAISQAEKLEVEMSTHGLQKRLDFELELNLYRIIQELVHNVIKHAKASQISIEVNYLKDKVNVVVEDNGQGFDWKQVQANPGLGMINLEARVHGLNGEIHFDTIQGKRTTVMVRIPIFEKLSSPQ